jgi:hypothetical protein
VVESKFSTVVLLWFGCGLSPRAHVLEDLSSMCDVEEVGSVNYGASWKGIGDIALGCD